MRGPSLKRQALSGVRWMVSARVLVQLITWPSTIIVMRLLDPRDYGLVAVSSVLIEFVSMFADPGLAAGLVKEWTHVTPQNSAEYRALLDRKDIDVIHISTPEHWHVKIAIEAMQAGKDVYCEKPMTLTIAEGQLMCQAVKKTGRIVQIGTQQRSDAA